MEENKFKYKQEKCNKLGITLKVKSTETKIFEEFLDEFKAFLKDKRIDKGIREEYWNRLNEILAEQINEEVD